MTEKTELLHATIERERGRREQLERTIVSATRALRAEGDRMFEEYSAKDARPLWALAQELEKALGYEVSKRLSLT